MKIHQQPFGPHFERFSPLSKSDASINADNIDKNLLKALAKYYGNAILGDTIDFEDYLVDYFKIHYSEIISDDSNKFFYNFSNTSNDNTCDLYKITSFFGFEPEVFGNNFGSKLRAKEGLLFETNSNDINIIYGTNKGIASMICDLYGQGLYHRHLANLHSTFADNELKVQKAFIDYANNNGIDIENEVYMSLKPKKRFIKKKLDKEKSNIVNFEQAK